MMKILLSYLNKVPIMPRWQFFIIMMGFFLGWAAGITPVHATLKVEEILGSNPAQDNDLREWFCFTTDQVSWKGNCITNTTGAEAEKGTFCNFTFQAIDHHTLYTYQPRHTIPEDEFNNIKNAWENNFKLSPALCFAGIFLDKTTLTPSAHQAAQNELSFTWDHLSDGKNCVGYFMDSCPKKNK